MEGLHAWRMLQFQIDTVDDIFDPSLICLLATSSQETKLMQTKSDKNTRGLVLTE